MKNLNQTISNVTKTTMRELNSNEIDNVSGGFALITIVPMQAAEEIIDAIVEVVAAVLTIGG